MTLTTKEVRQRVHNRFTGNGFHVLKEVRFDRHDGVRARRCDLVAVGVQRATGHEIHGIEIKVSRSDWLQELREPEKYLDPARYCHRWWFAVGDPTIIKPGELPGAAGLLVPRGAHMVALTQASLLDPIVDHRFVASLVQSASTQHGYCAAWARMTAYAKGLEEGRKRVLGRRVA